MTHEPECEQYVYEIHKPRPSSCMLCLIAKEAYQRGREDAANDVSNYLAEYGATLLGGEKKCITAAARGDGDTAQIVRDSRNDDNRMDGERA